MTTLYEQTLFDARIDLGSWGNYRDRQRYVRQFAWAIPNRAALIAIAEVAAKAQQPILEVACGSGYWAWEMRQHGIRVKATDIAWPDNNSYGFTSKWIQDIHCKGAPHAVRDNPNHVLMMVWPCYRDNWSYRALKMYTGRYFIYVGESSGGCTGSKLFHDYLYDHFTRTVNGVDIPVWSGIHDDLYVYERKEPARGPHLVVDGGKNWDRSDVVFKTDDIDLARLWIARHNPDGWNFRYKVQSEGKEI